MKGGLGVLLNSIRGSEDMTPWAYQGGGGEGAWEARRWKNFVANNGGRGANATGGTGTRDGRDKKVNQGRQRRRCRSSDMAGGRNRTVEKKKE